MCNNIGDQTDNSISGFFTIPLHNDGIFQQACGHLLMPQVTKLML